MMEIKPVIVDPLQYVAVITPDTYLTGQYVRLTPEASMDVSPDVWPEIESLVGRVTGGILGPVLQVAVDFGEPRPDSAHDCGGLVPNKCGFWFMADHVSVLMNYDPEAE
ncbi:MAG: hypothetical protein L0287_37930 [Anaerolineae bacterium]|nr:hypothetical protein [Anaerolineae bacterium]